MKKKAVQIQKQKKTLIENKTEMLRQLALGVSVVIASI